MICAVLDFKERTITIDDILLPMRNINNLQLKPSIFRVLKLNSNFAQEPASTRNATKCIVKTLDAKYDRADLPSIVKNNCEHLFQAEMGNLTITLEYIKAYIDDPLVITKGSLDDHLDKLKQVFIQLRNQD
jgi:hypothetical protein